MSDDQEVNDLLQWAAEKQAAADQAERLSHWQSPDGYHRCSNCGTTVLDGEASCPECTTVQVWTEFYPTPVRVPTWAWLATMIIAAITIGATLILVAGILLPAH